MSARLTKWLGSAVRTALSLGFRAYVLCIIALVGWLSYRALRYLIVSLIFASPPPETITALPTRMDATLLETQASAWEALRAAEHPRAPLAHYHSVDGWFQPDRFNDCTRSGCHTPMPHNARKEVRAFLNMHATSIHCGVCHMASEDSVLQPTWYSLRNGGHTQAPALLQVYGWLTSTEGQKDLATPTHAVQRRLVGLLRAAAEQSGSDPTLTRLADELEAVRHTSDAFQALVATARTQVPLRFHGQYGAKLALRDASTGQPILGYPGTAEAVAEFQRRGEAAEAAERDLLLGNVHAGQRTDPLQCTTCHRQDESLLDLRAAGYPPARIASLRTGQIFRAIEEIANGRPLHLPDFATPDGERRPASAPSTSQP